MNTINRYLAVAFFVIFLTGLGAQGAPRQTDVPGVKPAATASGLVTGTNSGEDAPLNPGSFVLQGSVPRDMPSPTSIDVGPLYGPERNRGAIIAPSTPDGDIRIVFEKPVDQTKVLFSLIGKTLRLEFEPPIKINPPRWKSSTELLVSPAKGQISQGDYLRVSLRGKVPLDKGGEAEVSLYQGWYVTAFSMGSKSSAYPVVKGKPRLVASLDSGMGSIGAGNLNLLYDQVVLAKDFADEKSPLAIKASWNGKALKTTISNPRFLSFDQAGEYDLGHVVQVELSPMPPHGSTVEVRVPTLDEYGTLRVETLSKVINTRFFIESDFFDRTAQGIPADITGSIRIGFSNRFDFEALRSQIIVEPQPLGLYMWRDDYDNSVYLQYRFKPGQKYRLKISKYFPDLLGNFLDKSVDLSIQARDLPPVLTMAREALTLEGGRNRLPLQIRNVGKVVIRSWLVNESSDFAALLARQPLRGEISKPSGKAGKEVLGNFDKLDMNLVHTVDLGMGKELGLKIVEVEATGRGTESGNTLRAFTLVQSTDLGVSTKLSEDQAFVWVTALGSAKPVAGATVKVSSADGTILGTGLSNKDGTVVIQNLAIGGGEDGSPKVYVSAETKADKAVSTIHDAELSQAWQFNLPGRVKGAGKLPAAVFTERGAYRPGETVYIKALMRPDPQFDKKSLNLLVRDPQGQTVLDADLSPDEFRGIDTEVNIVQGAPVGEYQIYLSHKDWSTRASFRVEEYRVPTFQVEVKGKDSPWISGNQVDLTARAAYLQGALMDGSDITWRVYRQPDDFIVAGLPGYIFTGPRDPSLTGSVKVKEGVLNADSQSMFSFIPESSDPNGPLRYIVQASVTDPERQTYAGRLSRTVHSSSLYVGLRPPPRTVFKQGEQISVPVVVVDTNGKIQPNKTVSVWLDRVSYHSSTMMDEEGGTETYSREVIDSYAQNNFISKASPEPLNISIDETGLWELRVVVKDSFGQEAQTLIPLTINGEESSSWPRFDRERIEIVLDKASYKAGDTAQLVVQTPFDNAEGLITIEGEGVLDYQRFTIKGNTPAIKIPVKAAYAPNVFVSVVLLRGRSHDLADASGFETGAPAYRVGYARMDVDAAERRLQVAVSPSATEVKPGSELTVKLALQDWKGKSSGAASATVMVVDEAVLGLTGYKTPDPVALAYALRLLGIRNASNLLDLPHSRRNRLETLFPGGDSDESQAMLDGDMTRRLFKSTAYWNPALRVSADGMASFSFAMPDNLSTYRVMVVAADRDGRMGSGQSQVRSSLPLMVQAVIPRFVYPGDQLSIQSRLFNTTDKGGSVAVESQFKGFKITEKPSSSLQVQSKQDGLLTWKATVEASAGDKASVSFAAAMGKDKDAVLVELPVLSPGNRQTLVSSANFSGTGDLSLDLPSNRLGGTGTYEVVLSTSALSELKDAVSYLMGYPNGCIEQTTSTAYPLIVLKDLLPSIGVEVNMADLKNFSEAGVKRILSFQTSAGGLAYWPGSNEPHAFATSFGLTCLLEAKKRGYDVPDQALKGMADYLEATLRKGEIREDIPHGSIADGDTRALFVMTLGRLGRPQPGYIQELWRMREKLTPFGLSFLAVAIRESKDQSLLEPALEALRQAAKIDSDEAWYEIERKGGYSFDSPLRTHAGALLAYAVAGGKADMSGRLLKGFLARREYGLWGNTQENVFGIMAIYTLVTGGGNTQAGGLSTASSEGGPVITVNGTQWKASALEQPSHGMYRLRFNDSTLGSARSIKVAVNTGGSAMYATIRASFDTPLDERFRSEQNRGFAFTRSYETADGKSLDPKNIPLGTLVKVRLFLRASEAKNYVAIDDKLPAGFEALNMNLETTDKGDMGTLSDRATMTLPTISYQEVRDHRVAFYVDAMTPGDWEFVYFAKASTPGTFLAPAGLAEAMYEPEFNGKTKVETVTVK